MKKVLIVALTLALSLGFLAFANGPRGGAAAGNPGECVRAGIGTLQSLDAVTAAAQQQIDYSAFVDVPEGTFLSLGEVVKLHVTNPELFTWCTED